MKFCSAKFKEPGCMSGSFCMWWFLKCWDFQSFCIIKILLIVWLRGLCCTRSGTWTRTAVKPKDFKSFVSTIPPSGQEWLLKTNRFVVFLCDCERKTGLEPATPTLARSCSTNWAIFAICCWISTEIVFSISLAKVGTCPSFWGKVVLYQLSYFRNLLLDVFLNTLILFSHQCSFNILKAGAKIDYFLKIQNEFVQKNIQY